MPSAPLQRGYHPLLVLRRHPAEEVGALDAREERRLGEVGELAPAQDAGHRDAELATGMAGDEFGVAGQDLELDAELGERPHRLARALLRRVEEGDIAGENQRALVG